MHRVCTVFGTVFAPCLHRVWHRVCTVFEPCLHRFWTVFRTVFAPCLHCVCTVLGLLISAQLCHYSSTQEQKSTIKEYFERNGIFKRFNEEFGDYQDCVFIKTPSGAFSMKLSHRSEQLTTTIVFWRVFSLRLKLIKLTLAYFKFQVTFLRLWLICWFEKNKIQRGRTQTETPFAIWRLEFEWIDWKFV